MRWTLRRLQRIEDRDLRVPTHQVQWLCDQPVTIAAKAVGISLEALHVDEVRRLRSSSGWDGDPTQLAVDIRDADLSTWLGVSRRTIRRVRAKGLPGWTWRRGAGWTPDTVRCWAGSKRDDWWRGWTFLPDSLWEYRVAGLVVGFCAVSSWAGKGGHTRLYGAFGRGMARTSGVAVTTWRRWAARLRAAGYLVGNRLRRLNGARQPTDQPAEPAQHVSRPADVPAPAPRAPPEEAPDEDPGERRYSPYLRDLAARKGIPLP